MRSLDATPRLGGDASQLTRFRQGRRQFALTQADCLDHLCKRVEQDADLVGTQGLMRGAEVAGFDPMRRVSQLG